MIDDRSSSNVLDFRHSLRTCGRPRDTSRPGQNRSRKHRSPRTWYLLLARNQVAIYRTTEGKLVLPTAGLTAMIEREPPPFRSFTTVV